MRIKLIDWFMYTVNSITNLLSSSKEVKLDENRRKFNSAQIHFKRRKMSSVRIIENKLR